ncbi:MAG: phosphatase PAP2 family protein [Candidatus Aenigmarchaeota archaeon]|nr:phosphatase PAP2 family protein [Candidatus Aenigmarchaeota archaeon]
MNFWYSVTILGDFKLWLLFAFISLFFYKKNKIAKKYLKIVFPSIIIAVIFSMILKDTFMIPRPCVNEPWCPSTYSFPSGHSTLISAAFLSTLFAFRKKWLSLLMFVIAVMVMVSRVEIGVHTINDIIFGSMLGLSSALLIRIVSTKKQTIDFRWFLRKLIHFSTLIFVVIRLYDENVFLILTILAIVIYTILEYLRAYKKKSLFLYGKIVEICRKPHEIGFIVSPLLIPLALFISNFFGLKPFLVAGLALTVGDSLAGLIGKEFGRIRIGNGKSIEGSIMLLTSVFYVYSLLFGVKEAFVFSLIAMVVEVLIRDYDNLAMPIVLAIITKIMGN